MYIYPFIKQPNIYLLFIIGFSIFLKTVFFTYSSLTCYLFFSFLCMYICTYICIYVYAHECPSGICRAKFFFFFFILSLHLSSSRASQASYTFHTFLSLSFSSFFLIHFFVGEFICISFYAVSLNVFYYISSFFRLIFLIYITIALRD